MFASYFFVLVSFCGSGHGSWDSSVFVWGPHGPQSVVDVASSSGLGAYKPVRGRDLEWPVIWLMRWGHLRNSEKGLEKGYFHKIV